MKQLLTVITIVMLLSFLSCGSSQSKCNINIIPKASLPEGADWTGIWFTNYGQMVLDVKGKSVVGEYCDDEKKQWGKLEGTIEGDTIRFRWVTHDMRVVGKDRITQGYGIIQYKIERIGNRDVHKFFGTWGYENSECGGGIWKGEKSKRFTELYQKGRYQIPCEIKKSSKTEEFTEEESELEESSTETEENIMEDIGL